MSHTRVIWKYPLKLIREQSLSLPVGAVTLCVQTQGGLPCLWVMVDPKEVRLESADILIVGTGHDISPAEEFSYIGTIQMQDGALVWHVFQYMEEMT